MNRVSMWRVMRAMRSDFHSLGPLTGNTLPRVVQVYGIWSGLSCFIVTNEYVYIVCLGLSIDYAANELWWIAKQNETYQILFCKLGSLQMSSPCNETIFLRHDSDFSLLTAITVDDGVVYYAQGSHNPSLESVGKDGRNHRIIREYTPGVTALKIYRRNRLARGTDLFLKRFGNLRCFQWHRLLF